MEELPPCVSIIPETAYLSRRNLLTLAASLPLAFNTSAGMPPAPPPTIEQRIERYGAKFLYTGVLRRILWLSPDSMHTIETSGAAVNLRELEFVENRMLVPSLTEPKRLVRTPAVLEIWSATAVMIHPEVQHQKMTGRVYCFHMGGFNNLEEDDFKATIDRERVYVFQERAESLGSRRLTSDR